MYSFQVQIVVFYLYRQSKTKPNVYVLKYNKNKKFKNQPRVVDHSARGSMKNAANCVQTCELQDT